jgi:hypothetical protein
MVKKYFPLLVFLVITIIAIVNFWPSYYKYSESYEIQGIDFLIQPDEITCGPTSATMLLNRYGKHVTVHDVEGKTKTQWFVHNLWWTEKHKCRSL